MRTDLGGHIHPFVDADGKLDAKRFRDILRLHHHGADDAARAGIGCEIDECSFCQHAHRIEAEIAP
jgi:hypothetical protein